jgi:hypothetical protein
MAALIGALLIAGVAVAGVRATRSEKQPVAEPSVSVSPTVTATFSPSETLTPTESVSPSPSETVLPGETESPTPSETALAKTGDESGGELPLIALSLLIAIAGGAVLARAH